MVSRHTEVEMMLCDFHLHSNFSDGKLSIPQIVDLYGRAGFGAIAITDHVCENKGLLGKAARVSGRSLTEANFPLYQEILRSEAERARQLYNMIVLPGVELTKNSWLYGNSAHVLLLGVTEWTSADAPLDNLLRHARYQGVGTIAAHPVSTQRLEAQTYYLWSHREELMPYIDAWEVASGRVLFPEVQQSKLPLIANSDFHHPKHFESWKTVLECERHPQAILQAIQKQELRFHYYDATGMDYVSGVGDIVRSSWMGNDFSTRITSFA